MRTASEEVAVVCRDRREEEDRGTSRKDPAGGTRAAEDAESCCDRVGIREVVTIAKQEQSVRRVVMCICVCLCVCVLCMYVYVYRGNSEHT